MVAPLHIAICGAGPAGLSAALALNGLGHRISIFDQFEQPRALGSGLILQPTGLAVLDWLGLGDRMRGLGARIDRLYGKACSTDRVVLDVRYAALGEGRGLAVHRAALFNVLHEALGIAGIEVETSSEIKGIDASFVILSEARREGPFDLIVDALGTYSPLIAHASAPDARVPLHYGAIWASLPWPGEPFDPHALEQRYEQASMMAGVLPIGAIREGQPRQTAFFWSLKTEDFPVWKAEGLESWKARVVALWPETEPLLNKVSTADQMVLAHYDHHTLLLPHGRNLVFIGDSAHSTSPQLGQGANMALLDVMALASSLKENQNLQAAIEAYAKKRRFHVKLYQAMSRVFTPFYQSDSALLPMLRDYIVAPLSRFPPAQRLLAGIVSGQFGLPKDR